MGKFIDLTGQKFGKITVLKRAKDYLPPCGRPQTQWQCKCECGNKVLATGNHLKNGAIKSCGCVRKQTSHNNAKNNFVKHGASKTSIYREWIGIKSRCFNKNEINYKNYGYRGITMCDRWHNSFEAFYADVSKLPHFGEKGYTLNRIDNNGNYEPNNVEWADPVTQANNKRNNHLITYNGKTQSLSQWAKEINIKRSTLAMRIEKYHWSIERALSTK